MQNRMLLEFCQFFGEGKEWMCQCLKNKTNCRGGSSLESGLLAGWLCLIGCSATVFHAAHIVSDRLNAVRTVFCDEFNNGRTDNRAVRHAAHLLCLLRCGNAKANSTRDVTHFLDQAHHCADVGRDLSADSGNAERKRSRQSRWPPWQSCGCGRARSERSC